MKNIVFTGGGSAGHIMPNIALIENLQNYKIYYLGTNGMEKELVTKYPNIEFVEIPAVKFIRSFTPKNFLIPFKLIKSISYCKYVLKKISPAIIFSKGGFVSIPVSLAGNLLKIPVLTHESDMTVGLANKIISFKAKHLCCSFKETSDNFKRNSIYTGSPIRNKIYLGKKEIIFDRHNLSQNKPIILIIGGSLGAKPINEIIFNSLDELVIDYNILHIVGKNKININFKNQKNYIQIEFAKDIENYFDASDIVISRSGSNTIFELLALKKPMILIPLPKGNSRGDQILNAQTFEKNNLAKVILQENLNINTLKKAIKDTLTNKEQYIKNMSKIKNINGNNKILDLIYKYSK